MLRRVWATNLLITVVGLILFASLHIRSGRIEANDGLGSDGRQYAHMVTARIYDGTVATQTRPLLPFLTRLPYYAGLDIIPAFQAMNFIYAAVLYFFLCLILDLYEIQTSYKAYFIVTVALCIATSKMFAYYPTLIDLGALAVLCASTYIVLTRGGWAACAAALLAVGAREFGVALAFLGFHRELRQGQSFFRALLTYAPAVIALFVIREWASTTNLGDRRRALLTASDLLANLELWRDPFFGVFFVYFLVTILGGITLLFLVKPGWFARRMVEAPELLTFTTLIVGAAVVGNADIWRYLVFLLPVIAIVFACYARDIRPGPVILAAAFVLTFLTQQPYAVIDTTEYFRNWFPAYIYRTDAASPLFWSTWWMRLALTCGGTVALGLLQWWTLRTPRAVQSEAPSR